MIKHTKDELDARLNTPRGSHNVAAIDAEYAHYLVTPGIDDDDAAYAEIDAYFDEGADDVEASS